MKSPVFHDRQQAGLALAERLSHYKDDPDAMVVGLSEGGIVVAAAISDALRLPLEVFIARKLRAPCDRKCALGAITETGVVYIDERVLCAQNCLSRDLRAYMEHESEVQRAEIGREKHFVRRDQPIRDVSGKPVVLVADGIAAGAMFCAAAESLRKLGAARIVGAVPLVGREVIRQMRDQVDELVVLLMPESFKSVEEFFSDFAQISNEEVARLIAARRPSCTLKPPA